MQKQIYIYYAKETWHMQKKIAYVKEDLHICKGKFTYAKKIFAYEKKIAYAD